MDFGSITLTLTGLSSGVAAVVSFYLTRKHQWGLALMASGVAGLGYILGRYVIYPASVIPYTGLLFWYLLTLAAIIGGGLWALVSKKHD